MDQMKRVFVLYCYSSCSNLSLFGECGQTEMQGVGGGGERIRDSQNI